MFDDRWQMISRDGGLFNILRDTQTTLSTVELPAVWGPAGRPHRADYRYESCLFTPTDSEVVARYRTLSEAVEGHTRLAKKYNLK